MAIGIEGLVTDIIEDLYNVGNYIFADSNSVKTTDGTTVLNMAGSPHVRDYIDGAGEDARFDTITSLLQLNRTHVIVSDTLNYCLRVLDMASTNVSVYAGTCTQKGDVDGYLTAALFSRNRRIVRGHGESRNVIFVADAGAGSIKAIDLTTNLVSTVSGTVQLRKVASLVVNTVAGDSILAFHTKFIKKLTVFPEHSRSVETIFNRTHRAETIDGVLNTSVFVRIDSVIQIGQAVYLLSDTNGTAGIRVIDLETKTVSSICSNNSRFVSGSISECSLEETAGIYLQGARVYIGSRRRIITLSRKLATNSTYTKLSSMKYMYMYIIQ